MMTFPTDQSYQGSLTYAAGGVLARTLLSSKTETTIRRTFSLIFTSAQPYSSPKTDCSKLKLARGPGHTYWGMIVDAPRVYTKKPSILTLTLTGRWLSAEACYFSIRAVWAAGYMYSV